MSLAIDISSEHCKMLLELLRQYIPGAEVWAYGSRVKGTARRNSDLDLVAFIAAEQQRQVSELRDALDESNLPFIVDLHIWDNLPEHFHETIRKEHIVLEEASRHDEKLGALGYGV